MLFKSKKQKLALDSDWGAKSKNEKKGSLSIFNFQFSNYSGFTLVEMLVTIAIFIFMTALLVAKYGSFNDGTILTSMAYDVALTLRDAQSYGLNVQGYQSSSGLGIQSFNYPYGIHFNATSPNNTKMTLFADSYSYFVASQGLNEPFGVPDGICTEGGFGSNMVQTCQKSASAALGDLIMNVYTLTNGGFISALCVTNNPASSGDPCTSSSSHISPNYLDITFKRPDPNAIISVMDPSTHVTTTYPYAEIQVENAANTSTRTIVVRGTGEIEVKNQ